MKKNIPYSLEIRNKVIEEYKNNLGSHFLAKKYNIDHKTILRWVRIAGVKRNREESNKVQSLRFKGIRRSPETEFKKGIEVWNKGTKQHFYCVDCGIEISFNGERCDKHYRIFNKGKNHYGFNKHRSLKTKQKISKNRKGIEAWNKGKEFIQISGSKHWNWQDGITPLYSMIRNSDKEINWRKSIYKRDNYTCQECYKKGCALQAHHIKPFSQILKEFLNFYNQFSPIDDKETLVRLSESYKDFWDINNGKTLCEDCHNETKIGAKQKA